MSGQMPEFPVENPQMTTLETVLAEWQAAWRLPMPDQVRNDLVVRLRAREDAMADVLRLAGVQFGLFSEIVAEVLAQVGLGSPIDDVQREFVRAQFVALMERLREEYEQRGGDTG